MRVGKVQQGRRERREGTDLAEGIDHSAWSAAVAAVIDVGPSLLEGPFLGAEFCSKGRQLRRGHGR